jgi:hypothetical protein
LPPTRGWQRTTNLRLLALRIQARAERRCGELLKQLPRGDEATRYGQAGAHPPVTRTSAAADAGLSDHRRKTALRIASVPQAEFERAIESESPPTITRLAERGTATRPTPSAPALPAADPAEVSEAQSALRAFAEFCSEHDAASVAASSDSADAEPLRGYVAVIDDWLDRFVTNLPSSRGGLAA